MNLYNEIFKRKSTHSFRNMKSMDEGKIDEIRFFICNIEPLYKDIHTDIRIVRSDMVNKGRGAEYAILFYSEPKDNYLMNIGYIGEIIDLYLTSLNLASLWCGMSKPLIETPDGMEYVIMILFGESLNDVSRKDMYKATRKNLNDIWKGDEMEFSDIIRFAPSACNLQPWMIENDGHELKVYRDTNPLVRGIIPKDRVIHYNQIDIGIMLVFIEICLKEYGYEYDRMLYHDDGKNKTLISSYKYDK